MNYSRKLVASPLSRWGIQVGTLFNVGKGTNFLRNEKMGVDGEYVGSGSALTEQIFTKKQGAGLDPLCFFIFF